MWPGKKVVLDLAGCLMGRGEVRPGERKFGVQLSPRSGEFGAGLLREGGHFNGGILSFIEDWKRQGNTEEAGDLVRTIVAAESS